MQFPNWLKDVGNVIWAVFHFLKLVRFRLFFWRQLNMFMYKYRYAHIIACVCNVIVCIQSAGARRVWLNRAGFILLFGCGSFAAAFWVLFRLNCVDLHFLFAMWWFSTCSMPSWCPCERLCKIFPYRSLFKGIQNLVRFSPKASLNAKAHTIQPRFHRCKFGVSAGVLRLLARCCVETFKVGAWQKLSWCVEILTMFKGWTNKSNHDISFAVIHRSTVDLFEVITPY